MLEIINNCAYQIFSSSRAPPPPRAKNQPDESRNLRPSKSVDYAEISSQESTKDDVEERKPEESRTKRNLKRKSSSIDETLELDTTPAKVKKVQFKDPDVQVGLVKSNGEKSVLVPETQFLSLAPKLEQNNLVKIHKAMKKPMGKGYSKGKYGEETVIQRISPSKAARNSTDDSQLDDIPDLIDIDGNKVRPDLPTSVPGAQIDRKRRKRGSVCTISRKTPNAKRMTSER